MPFSSPTDFEFNKILTKLYSLGSIRGAASGKMLITHRTVRNVEYMVVISKREPAATVLPFNVLWMPFDDTKNVYRYLLRRFAKEPVIVTGSIPADHYEYRNSWGVVESVDDICEEQQYYDIYDSTLRGDYIPQTPITIYPASTSVAGTVMLSVDDVNAQYPVVVGNNDTRLINSRVPIAHSHPEFNNLPGLTLSVKDGSISMETLNAPSSGDVLFITENPFSAIWRKPKISDVSGYLSPAQTLRINGPQAVSYSTTEHSTLTVTAEVVRYNGVVDQVTTDTVFSVTGLSDVSVVGNVITFGGVTTNVSALITATYLDPISNVVLTATSNVAVMDVPAPDALYISGINEFDELTSTTYSAQARYTDGTVKDVTGITTWMIDTPAYAHFNDNILTALDVTAGATKRVQAIITASYTDDTGPVSVTVTATKSISIVDKDLVLPVSMTIVGPSSVVEGNTITYVPQVTYSNGTYDNLPASGLANPVWSTPHPDYVSITGNQVEFAHILHTVTNIGLAVSWQWIHPVTNVSSTLSATKQVTITENNVIDHIRITGSASVNENSSSVYTAFVEYDDGLAEDVSNNCTWRIVLPNGTLVSNTQNIDFIVSTRTLMVRNTFGEISPVTIYADYNSNGVIHTGSIEVTLVDVTVYPRAINIIGPSTVTEQTLANYAATIEYTDGTVKPKSNIAWVSSNGAVASFTGSSLIVSNITEDHDTTVIASYNETIDGHFVEVEASTVVHLTHIPPIIISIELDLTSGLLTIDENTSQQLKFKQFWNDGSVTITSGLPIIAGVVFTSSDDLIASVDQDTWVITTHNILMDKPVTINTAWHDPDTDITHTHVLNLTVLYVAPALLSLVFDQTGPVSITEFMTSQFTLTGMYDDDTTAPVPANLVTFSFDHANQGLLSLNNSTNALTVTANNILYTDSPVSTTITASYLTKTVNISVEVVAEMISVMNLSLEGGVTTVSELSSTDLVLTALFDNGITRNIAAYPDVVWTVSDSAVATIATGVLNALDVTSDKVIDISATYQGITVSMFDVHVGYIVPDLLNITMTVSSQSILESDTATVTNVTAHYSDNTTVDITDTAVLSVLPNSVGTITNKVFTPDALSILADIDATITATYMGMTDSKIIAIEYIPILVSYDVSETNGLTSLVEDQTAQLYYKFTYDNGSVVDKSSAPGILWETSDSAVISLLNQTGGIQIHPVAADTPCTITATLGTEVATLEITVLNVTVTALDFDPSTPAELYGTNEFQLVVKATRSNGSIITLPAANVVFTSSDDLIATVSTSGLITAIDVAADTTVDITATVDAVTKTSTIAIKQLVITAIEIAPLAAMIYEDSTFTLGVNATRNDGQVVPVPATGITFASSDDLILSVDADGVVTVHAVTVDSDAMISADYIANPALTDTVDVHVLQNTVSNLVIHVVSTTVNEKTPTNSISVSAHYANGMVVNDLTTAMGLTLVSGTPAIVAITDNDTEFKFDALSVLTTTPVTITATFESVTQDVILSVVDVPSEMELALVSQLTSPQNELAEGGVVQLSATVTYDDGRVIDVTNHPDIVWSTDRPTAATVSSTGMVTTYNVAENVATTRISAVYHGISAFYILRVLDTSH